MSQNKTKKLRAIRIDAQSATVMEYENTGLASLQKAVGGLITVAAELPGGETLFVDDEGLLKRYPFGFVFKGHQFSGSGVLVGRCDDDGNDTDCTLDVKTVRRGILFWEDRTDTIERRNQAEIDAEIRSVASDQDGESDGRTP